MPTKSRKRVNVVFVASKQFLRTRDGFNASPSIRGFARHIEANMRLYEAFVRNDRSTERFTFGIWRLLLVAVSETVFLFNKAVRIWREV